MTKERLLSIDLIRVLVAFSVIIIHAVSGSYFMVSTIGYHNWLVSASIGWLLVRGSTLFVLLSGSLLIKPNDTETYWQFLHKRAGKIIIPLVFWNIFYYFFASSGGGNLPEFLYQLSRSGTFSHLYFLNIMVGLYLVTPFISKIVTKVNLNIVVPILIISSALYHLGYCFFGTPKAESIIVLFIPYLGFYLAGYWVKSWPQSKLYDLFGGLVTLFFVFSVLITCKLVFIFGTHDRDTILVSSLSIPVAAFSIFAFYKLRSIANSTLSRYSKFLQSFSKLSLGVYLIHPFFLVSFSFYPAYSYLLVSHYWFWLSSIIVLATILSFSSVYLIQKIPFVNRIV